MYNLHPLLHFDKIRFIDQSLNINTSAMQSFATDDALCLSISSELSPLTARLWVHDRTVVLGIPDSRLPHLNKGISYLQKAGYHVVIRNSGGLAVVLDQGVLNLTFIFPDGKKLGIHEGYKAMVSFIEYLFSEEEEAFDVYEVKGSYCPGEYDISVNGRKFAGISQRRVKNGTAVQIYMCIEGSGAERAELVKEFYTKSLENEQVSYEYPAIQPETMASLSELLKKPLKVSDVRNKILYTLNEISSSIITQPLQGKELEWYTKRMKQMETRNEKVL
ncbi:octanoyl-[GcvH]:protein N-octanoyltransferase [Salinibacillus kushneri]|uniref:Octanoyl-[GcvH]:protein N-octanoyltransferase n=1 Tax=Salinibacillus kushneri TaxID=237682 RepID=A0A1I0CSJ8_9BACI|nr:lipoate--protein ligase family protein [Salinibacillus kushneri]SET22713.1 octanoyl-[GcvH]:protein N-octanoyltransferase [Salinibacillus kushneri]